MVTAELAIPPVVSQHLLCRLHLKDLMIIPAGTLVCVVILPGEYDEIHQEIVPNQWLLLQPTQCDNTPQPLQHYITSSNLLGGDTELQCLYKTKTGSCAISFLTGAIIQSKLYGRIISRIPMECFLGTGQNISKMIPDEVPDEVQCYWSMQCL